MPNQPSTQLAVPHSTQAEQCVLGALMLDNDRWDEINILLTAQDFFVAAHRHIFKAMSSLSLWHCCKVSDEAAFCLIQRPYISKTLLTRRISPRGSP